MDRFGWDCEVLGAALHSLPNSQVCVKWSHMVWVCMYPCIGAHIWKQSKGTPTYLKLMCEVWQRGRDFKLVSKSKSNLFSEDSLPSCVCHLTRSKCSYFQIFLQVFLSICETSEYRYLIMIVWLYIMFSVCFHLQIIFHFSRTAKAFHDRALLHFARLTPVFLVDVTSSRHHARERRGPLRHSYHQSQLHHGNHQHQCHLLPRQPKVTEPKLFLF